MSRQYSRCFCGTSSHEITCDGERVCQGCGLVIAPDARSAEYVKGTRVIPERVLPEKLGISAISQDIAQHKTLEEQKILQIYHSLISILQKISAPNVITEQAFMIARRCISEEMVPGLDVSDIAVACAIISCKIHGRPVSNDMLVKIGAASKRGTYRAHHSIMDAMRIGDIERYQLTIRWISKICSEIEVDRDLLLKAIEKYESLHTRAVFDGYPSHVIACAVIRDSSECKVVRLAKVADVDPRRISRLVKKMRSAVSHETS